MDGSHVGSKTPEYIIFTKLYLAAGKHLLSYVTLENVCKL